MTEYTNTLDVKGENCPMPVVKTQKETKKMEENDVLRVLSTDSGSISDIAGWAESTDNVQLIDQEEQDDLYVHYIEKLAE